MRSKIVRSLDDFERRYFPNSYRVKPLKERPVEKIIRKINIEIEEILKKIKRR